MIDLSMKFPCFVDYEFVLLKSMKVFFWGFEGIIEGRNCSEVWVKDQ